MRLACVLLVAGLLSPTVGVLGARLQGRSVLSCCPMGSMNASCARRCNHGLRHCPQVPPALAVVALPPAVMPPVPRVEPLEVRSSWAELAPRGPALPRPRPPVPPPRS